MTSLRTAIVRTRLRGKELLRTVGTIKDLPFLDLKNEIIEFTKEVLATKKIYLDARRLPKLICVTASDNSHKLSLIRLLNSIRIHVNDCKVIVYDLGMST